MFVVAVAGLRIGERRTLAQLGAYEFAVAVAVGALIARTATSSTTSFATGAVVLVALLLSRRAVTELRRRHWDVQYLLYESRGAITLVTTDDPIGPLLRDGLAAARVRVPEATATTMRPGA